LGRGRKKVNSSVSEGAREACASPVALVAATGILQLLLKWAILNHYRKLISKLG